MKPFNILIVEDESIVAMDIQERLAAMGYHIAGRAVSGEQALALAEQRRPDLVLMDIRLQGTMDGIDAASEIHRQFHRPVIFLTAYSEDETLERAKLAEPFGYILKPINDRELKSTIEMALYKHHAETEILRYQEERELTLKLLRLLNDEKDPLELIQRLTGLLQEWTGCEAAGVRLRDGDDFPYFETRGFPAEFVRAENSLCARDENGQIMRDFQGNPVIECMCGNILSGRFNPALPFFTKKGSFWSNNTTELLASTSDADRQTRTRNRCNGEGYESVALIALRHGSNTLGLLQFNDRAKGRFTPEMIAFLEKAADQVAMALAQQESEAALRESEERLRMALYAAKMDAFQYNPATGRSRRTGSRTRDWHLPAEGPGADYLSKIHPEDRKQVLAKLRGLTPAQPSYTAEYRLLDPDGVYRWIADWAEARFDASGRMTHISGVGADITDRKRAEEESIRIEAQFRQAQKMEALGTLAGGIAHDFNNILAIILGYAEIAHQETAVQSHLHNQLEHVIQAALRAKDLVQQILAFSRRSDQERRPVQVGLIVKEALKMLRASLPSTIVIESDVASKAIVMADPIQIHQVLMNLCTNAAQAMRDEGGLLHVSLRDVRLGAEAIEPHWAPQPGPHLRLTVKDSGHGIDPSILDRIFDPFFTTKEVGVGTGLGLAVVHGIVRSYGGAVQVESLPGKGSTFHVFFPSIESAGAPETVKRAPLPHGSERILLVDDEPALAMAAKQMLERLGYEVDYQPGGQEALDAFRSSLTEKPFDLVITDMTMPHLTGVDLAVQLRRMRPTLPVILCTGFSEKINEEKARSFGIDALLMKPFEWSELAELIRSVLDKGRRQT